MLKLLQVYREYVTGCFLGKWDAIRKVFGWLSGGAPEEITRIQHSQRLGSIAPTTNLAL